MPLTLSEIHVYPVKSLRGLSPQHWQVDRFGFAGDRRWMLVNEADQFVTQRQLAHMALIDTRLDEDRLVLSAEGMEPIELLREPSDGEEREVTVWNDRVSARDAGDRAADRLSNFLGQPVRLVHFPPGGKRPVDPTYAEALDYTAFSDGFPFLLISQASLDDLNARLEHPLPMLRFRPNLVVAGSEPYAEDRWRRIRIGEMELRLVKPCSRCVIPTIDLQTAEKGPEPLRTLSRYRRQGSKVYFGQNLLHDGIGRLSLGDEVEVMRYATD